MSKVSLRAQSRDRLMLGKLSSVVEGEGMHMLGIRRQHLDDRISHYGGMFALNPFHQVEPTLSLSQGHQDARALFAEHRIGFPVTEPFPAIDDGWPLIDGARLRDRRAFAMAAFAIPLTPLSQLAIKLATAGFVPGHITVNPLVADRKPNVPGDGADLRGAPLPAQQLLNKLLGLGINLILPGFGPSYQCLLMCLCRHIVAPMTVTPELSEEHGNLVSLAGIANLEQRGSRSEDATMYFAYYPFVLFGGFRPEAVIVA